MKKCILFLVTLLLSTALFAFPVFADTQEETSLNLGNPQARSSSYTLDFTISGTYDYPKAQEVLTILNQQRNAAGLASLTLDPTLTEMAMQRAAETAVYWDHTRPDGSKCDTILGANSKYSVACAENIAAGQTTAASVMTSWTNSPGHYQNMMSADYSGVGIGCFYQNGTIFWVQLFNANAVSGSIPSVATPKTDIPITLSSDYLSLHYAGFNDCNVPLYQGCTGKAGIYLTNQGYAYASNTYLSGGYYLASTDTSIATTSGSTITGIAPGTVDVELHFSNGYFTIPYEILSRPTLSCSFDSNGNPVITCNNEGNGSLYLKESGDDLWTRVSVNPTTNTFTHYQTFPGEVYTYVVQYYDDDYGWVEVSDRLVVTVPLATPKVTVSNVASTGKIKLSWDSVYGATKYQVYRATSKSGTYQLLTTTSNTSVVNSSTTAGKTYYYYVCAVASNGTKSEKSSVVYRCCDLPQPVVSVTNIASTGKIKLTWNAVTGADRYTVYYSTSKTGTYTALKTVTGTSLSHTSAKAGTTYYYKVKAVMDETSSATSAYSAYKYRCCDLAQPVVSVTNIASTGKIKLTWRAVTGANRYTVYYSTSKTGTYTALKTVTGTSLSHTSAKAGTTYYYKVKAVMDKTSSATSAYSAYKYRCCDLPRPVISSVKLNSSGKPVVDWANVSGAQKYKVYIYNKAGTKLLKTATVTGSKLTDSSAVKGTTYTYRVVAVHAKSSANSAMSVSKSITSK